MKAKLIRNRLTALIMSFIMMTGQVMPVMASGDNDETVAVATEQGENEEETSEAKEVIEMPAELFNIGVDGEEEIGTLNNAADDALAIYDIAEEADADEIVGEDEEDAGDVNADPRLGGLPVGNPDLKPSTVDQSISYKTIMEKVVDGAEFASIATEVKPGGAEATDAAFPFSSNESAKITAYFDENFPVARDQNPYGTCWAHSTLAANEFNMIKHSKAAKTVDTSELALAYWTSYQGTAGPAGDNGSTVKRKYAKSKQNNFLDSGGNSITAAMTLFQQRGITAEADVPYSDCAKVYESEKIDSALERKDAYYVLNYREYDLDNNPKLVKEGIIENGGLSVAFCWAEEAYNATYNSFYMDKEVNINHFVTLVGWDDNFSKSNFSGAYGGKPSNNGAWLARNSWNQDSSKAQMDYTEYFWISYEDMSICNVAGFDAVPASEYEYDNAYYYDTQVYNPQYYNSSTAANVYKVSVCDGGEILSAVSFNLFDVKSTGTDYTIEVYRNIPDGSDPSAGTKVDSMTTTGTIYMSGTYTIPLKDEVRLDAGENFAVVVTRNDNKTVSVATDFNWNGWNLVSDMKAQAGQSFLKSGSAWKDTVNDGNFVIHALTKNGGAYVKISPRSAQIPEEGEVTLSAEAFDESNNKVAGATFTWASDNTAVATVANGVVKAVSIGKATITATYNGLTGKCQVTVGDDGTTSSTVNYGTTNVNGVEMPLTANIRYKNTISYRARKINPKNDLLADVTSSSLIDIAKSLSAMPGSVTKDVISWKYTAKKNKNANSGSYFTVKAVVAGKAITNSQGISGKNLKALKKAVSAFNKNAKKTENRIYFNITPVNAWELANNGNMIPIVTVNRFTGAFVKMSHIRVWLEDTPAPSTSNNGWKNWKKLSKKDIKVKKRAGTRRTYDIIPSQKNVIGPNFWYSWE